MGGLLSLVHATSSYPVLGQELKGYQAHLFYGWRKLNLYLNLISQLHVM